jgi:hypothetical protein
MEVEMFDNWYITYLLAQHRYEQMQAEAQRDQTVTIESKKENINNGRFCKIMLFLADLLIKTGISLKKRWSLRGKNSCNGLATSLDDL